MKAGKSTLLLMTLMGMAAAPSLTDAAVLLSGSTTVGLDATTLSSVGVTIGGATGTGTATTTGFASGLTSVPFLISPGGTFSYTPATFPALGSFAGSIEHTGSVTLNVNTTPVTVLTVGNFSIRFDGGRAAGAASGFYVQDFFSGSAGPILFDLGILAAASGGTSATGLTATDTNFNLGPVNVLVSPELATLLGNNQLTGADVGDARIDGLAVPEPSSTILGMLAAAMLMGHRQRSAAGFSSRTRSE